MSGTNPTYPAGQCTRFVADNWSRPVGPYWGDASQWLRSASAYGYVLAGAPAVGAIAVWGPGAGGADPAGHVALVTGLAPLTVTEENWQGLGVVDSRVVDAGSLAGIAGYILPELHSEDPMTPDERTDLAGAQVAGLYAAVLHRDADEDPTGRDFWIAQMVTHGFTAAARAFVKEPESRTDIAAEAAGK